MTGRPKLRHLDTRTLLTRLEQHAWDMRAAAKAMGVQASTIRRELRRRNQPIRSERVAAMSSAELRLRYELCGRSLKRMAKSLHCSDKVLRSEFNSRKIERPLKSGAALLDDETICEAVAYAGSISAAAAQFGLTYSQLNGVIRRRRLRFPNQRWRVWDPEEIRRLYWDEEQTLAEIGKRYRTTENHVHKIMARHGIPRRTRAEARALSLRRRAQ